MRQPAHTFPTSVSPRSLLSHLRRMALGLALGLVCWRRRRRRR